MILQIKALSPKIGDAIPAPRFATPGSAAMDLCGRCCLPASPSPCPAPTMLH